MSGEGTDPVRTGRSDPDFKISGFAIDSVVSCGNFLDNHGGGQYSVGFSFLELSANRILAGPAFQLVRSLETAAFLADGRYLEYLVLDRRGHAAANGHFLSVIYFFGRCGVFTAACL